MLYSKDGIFAPNFKFFDTILAKTLEIRAKIMPILNSYQYFKVLNENLNNYLRLRVCAVRR
jgi:hypothetical protein